MTPHYDDATLLGFLDNEERVDAEAVKRHLAECVACMSKLDELREWSSVFTDAAVWRDVEPVDESRVSTLSSIGRRLHAEEIAAARFVGALGNDVMAWGEAIEGDPEIKTAGLARVLIDEARRRHNSSPPAALIVLDVAMSVLDGIVPLDPLLAGDVWKERANAFRLMGNHGKALAALDEAELVYKKSFASAFDCAFVYWGRATVYFATKRFADARSWIRRAAVIFEDHSDEMRLAQVRLLEGSILFDEGDIAGARDTFEALISLLSSFGDDESLARAYANLSGCEIRLREVTKAIEHASVAATLYRQLEMPAEAVRLHWSLGDALKLLGRSEEALDALRRAATHFEALKMRGAVATVGLDAAELLNERGEYGEAAAISARLVAYFRGEGADVDAADAVFHLQRAVEGLRATPELFGYVRLFLAARDVGDDAEFHPPDEMTN